MQEIFKDIKGYEGIYKVSNFGNVKSLNRIIVRSNGIKQSVSNKILTPAICKNGYKTVSLSNVKKHKTFYIHILVATAFKNHIPNGFKLVINHKDNNKLNNMADNLEIVTNRTNTNRKHVKHTSKYTGVCWHKKNKCWYSSITINNKSVFIGTFKNEYDAHLAYEAKLNILRMEYKQYLIR